MIDDIKKINEKYWLAPKDIAILGNIGISQSRKVWREIREEAEEKGKKYYGKFVQRDKVLEKLGINEEYINSLK